MESIHDNFLVYRYSLIKECQTDLFITDLPSIKGSVVREGIFNDAEFSLRGTRYAFVGFNDVNLISSKAKESRYIVGKLAKLREAHVGEKVPGDIIERIADDWLPIIVVFDVVEQFVFVQKSWRFGAESLVRNALQHGLRGPILGKYNYRIFVEVKTEQSEFWSLVETHKKIYRLELKLISPNILNTNKKARELLEDLQEVYGQDEFTMVLESESGSLEVPKDIVEDYIDYISEGEGQWSLLTEGARGGKKKHSSHSAPVTLDIDSVDQEGKDLQNEGQLELTTGKVAPERMSSDSLLVMEIFEKSKRLIRRDSNG
jgi:hypothetical protein